MKKAKLIAKYKKILEKDESSTDEMPTQIIAGVLRKLEDGWSAEQIEEERNINMQHMGADYFKKVKWVWNDAIKSLRSQT